MRLPRELAQQIANHAIAESPLEACGFVAFAEGEPVKVFEATNLARSSERFSISGAEQHRIVSEILDAGWTVGAIYHSHPQPDSECWPSAEDIRAHIDPEILSVIWATTYPATYVIGSFRIEDGEASRLNRDYYVGMTGWPHALRMRVPG